MSKFNRHRWAERMELIDSHPLPTRQATRNPTVTLTPLNPADVGTRCVKRGQIEW